MNHNKLRLISAGILLISKAALALPSDQQQPMMIQANTADIDHKTGVGVYTGNVTVDQGTSHLTANLAKTFTDEKNELIKATATGKDGEPAHFRTLSSKDKPELNAFANEIIFYPSKNKIVLLGNAKVSQGSDTFTAPRIEYDTKEQHVVTKANDSGRTKIVIHPRSKKGKALS